MTELMMFLSKTIIVALSVWLFVALCVSWFEYMERKKPKNSQDLPISSLEKGKAYRVWNSNGVLLETGIYQGNSPFEIDEHYGNFTYNFQTPQNTQIMISAKHIHMVEAL